MAKWRASCTIERTIPWKQFLPKQGWMLQIGLCVRLCMKAEAVGLVTRSDKVFRQHGQYQGSKLGGGGVLLLESVP